MKDFLMQTYTIVLPVLLGYIVWLLKRQKKDRDANGKETTVIFIWINNFFIFRGSLI